MTTNQDPSDGPDAGPTAPSEDEAQKTVRDCMADLSPANRRLAKICLFVGVISLVALPAIAIGLAAWKYKQEVGHSPFSAPAASARDGMAH